MLLAIAKQQTYGIDGSKTLQNTIDPKVCFRHVCQTVLCYIKCFSPGLMDSLQNMLHISDISGPMENHKQIHLFQECVKPELQKHLFFKDMTPFQDPKIIFSGEGFVFCSFYNSTGKKIKMYELLFEL